MGNDHRRDNIDETPSIRPSTQAGSPGGVILFSKSRAEHWWTCPRLEYLTYLWGQTGLRPVKTSFDLEYGTIIHEGAGQLARAAQSVADSTQALAEVIAHARTAMSAAGARAALPPSHLTRWQSLAEGQLLAFGLRILPALLQEFEIVDVEVPCVCPIDPTCEVAFVARPDLILRSRRSHGLWYWEHKTTSTIDAAWLNTWTKQVQVHSGIKAAQYRYREPFDGCYVYGWYKGYRDRYQDGKQHSPFTVGWRRAPDVYGRQRYEYKRPQYYKGWESFETATLVNGLASWITEMPDQILHEQFARTPPIMLREDLVDDFFAAIRFHITRILEFQQRVPNLTSAAMVQSALNEYFPQNFNQCAPRWGHPCPMQELCWQSWVQQDPLASGLYVRATDEHRVDFWRGIEDMLGSQP